MNTALLVVLCGAVLASAAAAQDQHLRQKVFFKDVPRTGSVPVAGSDGTGLRVFNGSVASRTQFPYQAGIYLNLANFCGGSLIHPKWVLTAAHCVDGFDKWAVFLGVSSMLAAKQEGRVVHISNWGVRHEAYDGGQITNDIGIIQLRREVKLNEFIQLSKLAPAGVNYAGRHATVSGFGKVDDDVSVISPVLRYTSLPVVSNAVCSRFYGSSDVSQICLEAKETSSCSGDSGGPLTIKEDNGAVRQIGLTSYGCSAGCTLGCPVGFTRINMFYDWLSQKTGINFPLPS